MNFCVLNIKTGEAVFYDDAQAVITYLWGRDAKEFAVFGRVEYTDGNLNELLARLEGRDEAAK